MYYRLFMVFERRNVMNGKKRMMILMSIVATMLIMGVGSIAHAEAANADTTYYYGIVKTGPLNVRSGPATTYASYGKIATGTKITITAITTVNNVKWYRITYLSKTAYVCGTYVQITASQTFYSSAQTATVFAGPLNVRSGPSTTSAIIGSAAYLKTVSVNSLYYVYGSAKWLRTTWNGKTGYLAAQYVAVNTANSILKKYTTPINGVTSIATALKAGPGSAYGTVLQLPAGTTMQLVGEIQNPTGEKWYLYKYAYALYYVHSKDISIGAATTSTNAQKIISLAYSKLGCAYVYGAEGPNTFDCSGFVYWVYNNSGISGISVPRSSYDLYNKYKAYSIGTSVANAKPGDILLFSDNGAASGICHSAIYYKDGTIIHASTPSTGVIITTVAYSTTNKSVFAIIRLPGL